MELPVTSVYAGISGIFLAGLSLNVIRFRRSLKVALGDGSLEIEKLPDDQKAEARKKYAPLGQAIRAQANFIEYIPLALILMAISEIQGVNKTALHVAGTVLLGARLAHFNTITASVPLGLGRTLGTAGTLFTIIGLAGSLLWNAAKKF